MKSYFMFKRVATWREEKKKTWRITATTRELYKVLWEDQFSFSQRPAVNLYWQWNKS